MTNSSSNELPLRLRARALKAGLRLPTFQNAHNAATRAFVHALGLHAGGHLESAVSGYRDALAFDCETLEHDCRMNVKDCSACQYNLGRCLEGVGDKLAAVEAFRRSLTRQDDDVNALFCLAPLLFELGDSLSAVKCYEDAFKYAPHFVTSEGIRTLGAVNRGVFATGADDSTRTVMQSEQLLEWYAYLQSVGYTAKGVESRLGRKAQPELQKLRDDEAILEGLGEDELGIAIRILLMGLCLDSACVSSAGFPLDMLLDVGLLVRCAAQSNYILSPVQLMPVQVSSRALLIAADWTIPTLLPSQDLVMAPGMDSFALLNLAPRDLKLPIVLDLCCGSGIQGLAALAVHATERVVAADVNPRCLHFTSVNAALNGFADKVIVTRSDLFSRISQDKFDAIYVNPPFVPAPFAANLLQATTFRDGGRDGTEVLRRVLQGTFERLKDGGFILIVAEICNTKDCDWLREEAVGLCDIYVYGNSSQAYNLDEYVDECCSEHRNGPGPDEWKLALQSLGVTNVGAVIISARRSDMGNLKSETASLNYIDLEGDGDDFLGIEESLDSVRETVMEGLRLPNSTMEGKRHRVSATKRQRLS